MDHFQTFRKYILVESENSLPLSKLKEQDMPEFSEIDKEILQFMADNTELVEDGEYVSDVGMKLYNEVPFKTSDNDAYEFLEKVGELEAIGYIIKKETEEFGTVSNRVIEDIVNKEYRNLANLYVYFKGEELLLASDILAQKIARGEDEMDQQDIDDLGEELEFLAS